MAFERRAHDTSGTRKQAGMVPTEYYAKQRVITVDGLTGTVASVSVSPFGVEDYEVILDHGMGGGIYSTSQLSPAPTQHEAVGVHLASDDYPILRDILADRPDIATAKHFEQRTAMHELTPGQRVMTFDGLTGTITGYAGHELSSFTGGTYDIFTVVLDNGMGGGQYSSNDLRPQTGTNNPIVHQATVSGSQMDGGFEDVSAGGSPGSDYEEGGDLQTGAALKENEYATYKNPHGPSYDESKEHKKFEPEHHPQARERHYPYGGGGDSDHNSMNDPVIGDVSKKYEPAHLVSLNSLTFEARRAVDAAVNNAWGEPQPTDIQLAPKPYGATTPKDPKANPGSQGWASSPDPEHWGEMNPASFGYSQRVATSVQNEELLFEGSTTDDGFGSEMIFESAMDDVDQSQEGPTVKVDDNYSHAAPSIRGDVKPHALLGEVPNPDLAGPGYPSGPKGGTSSGMPPGAPGMPMHQQPTPDAPGAEATLNDKPEGALPSTDGSLFDNDNAGVPEDDEALTPDRTASLSSIVESFQKSAAGQSLKTEGGSASEFGMELAAAAQQFLSKEALKDYSPGEQLAIINEGAQHQASNLDRLQLEGTHYMEDEDSWLS